ncbi:MAG: FUN14 domain-containing protein [Planctomycetota bacterium]
MNEANFDKAEAGDELPEQSGVDYQFTFVKKVVLATAVLLIVCGGVVHGLADDAPAVDIADSGVTGGSQPSAVSHGFAPGGDGQDPTLPGLGPDGTELQGDSNQPWSPALFRGGFGLFLGFAVGIALRLFLRMLGIVIGAQLLVLFLFSYLGWVEVHWETIDQHVKGWFASWGEEFASFQRFVTGHLPSTGLAGVGAWVGWKRQ